jgi:hypothetical protein
MRRNGPGLPTGPTKLYKFPIVCYNGCVAGMAPDAAAGTRSGGTLVRRKTDTERFRFLRAGFGVPRANGSVVCPLRRRLSQAEETGTFFVSSIARE